jgi:hypothetical protein
VDEPVPSAQEQAAYRVRWYRRPDPVNWRVRESSGLDPWTKYTSADLLDFWSRHPDWKCSERTARALAWLEDCFGHRN